MNQSAKPVIAIDGPAASGKTVVGREIAGKLGVRYLDTGVMYRAITWLALNQGISSGDHTALGRLASENPVEIPGWDGAQVTIAGHRLGKELRSPSVTGQVSSVSQVPEVRQAMVRQQRAFAARDGVVMVGRDIGTVVLPGAGLKIYLTASVEARAQRRWKELADEGRDISLEQVARETEERDRLDSQRSDSPLMAAGDAWVLDSTDMSVEQVVNLILSRFRPGYKAALA